MLGKGIARAPAIPIHVLLKICREVLKHLKCTAETQYQFRSVGSEIISAPEGLENAAAREEVHQVEDGLVVLLHMLHGEKPGVGEQIAAHRWCKEK